MRYLMSLLFTSIIMVYQSNIFAQSIQSDYVKISLPKTWHSQCKEDAVLGTDGKTFTWIDDCQNGHQFGNMIVYKPLIGTTSKSMIDYMVNSMIDTSEFRELCKFSLKEIDKKKVTYYEFTGKYKNHYVKGSAIATFNDELGIVIMDVQIPTLGFNPYYIWENLKWNF